MMWTDPAEQTGSDAEVAPYVKPEMPHIRDRREKWRLWFETETAPGVDPFWIAMQPHHMAVPMFRRDDSSSGEPTHSYGANGSSGRDVLRRLQLAIHKADAEAHHNEFVRRLP